MQHFKLYLFIKSKKKMHYWLLHINMIQWKWKKSLLGFMFSLSLADGTKARRSGTILIDGASRYFRMPFINIGQWFAVSTPRHVRRLPRYLFFHCGQMFFHSRCMVSRETRRDVKYGSVCKAALCCFLRADTHGRRNRFGFVNYWTELPNLFFFSFFFLKAADLIFKLTWN